jgi:hypothetical protein
MIHLGSHSPSGSAARDWEIGVPQTTNITTGVGYSFIVRDTANALPSIFAQWNSLNVGIGTTNANHLLVVGNSSAPAYCDGNTWQIGSDRNAKQDFSPVDVQEVLAKVAGMPITAWRYKVDGPGIEHLGPMAQDFAAAFGLNGTDNTHIATVDESGVALAAIQGLNQKLREELNHRDAELTELRAELSELKKMVDALNEKRNGDEK